MVDASLLTRAKTRRGAPTAETRPDATGVTLQGFSGGGTLLRDEAYDYRFTFVDAFGGETRASNPTTTLIAQQDGSIALANIPQPTDGFVATNVYRVEPQTGRYFLVAELSLGETTLFDPGRSTATPGSLLGKELGADIDGGTRLLPRFDARLSIDPEVIVKFDTSRIEATFWRGLLRRRASGSARYSDFASG